MSAWRAANPQTGIDLGDDMVRLLDLRFADDVLIFANTMEEAQNLLDSLVRHVAGAGLMLNTSKTVALTTEGQPPSFVQVGDSHMIKVLGYTESHKMFYQTPTALFRSNCFFNSLLRCRAPTFIKHFQKYDVQFRKLVRRIVGPPPGTDWSVREMRFNGMLCFRLSYISAPCKRCYHVF